MPTKSTFSRWKKADLIDLANKLEIDGFPNYAKKSDMIDYLESHLNHLEKPVDFKDDYPELRSFYESMTVTCVGQMMREKTFLTFHLR